MEAPEPPTAVEPLPPAFISRPGPACGSGEGVFQATIKGKYVNFDNPMSPDSSVVCSVFPSIPPPNTSRDSWILGRNEYGTVEVLASPAVVEPFQPAFNSRPGPTCGSGARVFQQRLEGKYDVFAYPMAPDSFSDCSKPPPHQLSPTLLDIDVDSDHGSAIEPLPQIVYSNGQHSSGLSIYYQNVRGLRTKTEEFYISVTASPYDVIVLTETRLDEEIPSCMLFNNDYAVYRGDRTALMSIKKRAGGVLVAVKSVIPSSLIVTNEESMEHVWVSLCLPQGKLTIGAVYIPPDMASDAQLMNRHISCMEAAISSSGHDSVAVFGDYNQPGLRWVRNDGLKCSMDFAASSLTQSNTALLDGMSSNNMWQMNSLKNRFGNTLDLVFIDERTANCSAFDEVHDPLVPVDTCHPPFSCTIGIFDSPLEFDSGFDDQALNFKKTNFEELCQHLSLVDWSSVMECSNLDEAVGKFTEVLQHAFSLFVPRQRRPRKPPWSNAELRRRKRRCKSAQKVYRKFRTTVNKVRFQFASRRYRNLNAQLYRRYVVSTERNLKSNPKSFWTFVKSKRKESGLPSSMHLDQRHASTSADKCELFASFFSSMFDSTSDSTEAALEFTPAERVDVDTFEVSEELLNEAVKKLKPSYQPGPDGIAACVLKKCSRQLQAPLKYLYNLSLRSATFPDRWKASFMCPVYKKGSKNDIRCYRGITSLCACSKLFEIMVSEHMFRHTKHYISPNQHGFFPGRSVATNLCEFTSFCLLSIEQGKQIDAIYTDLKAAFDKVDHSILLAKLGKLGCSSRLVEWFQSYLRGRKLAVKIGSSVSSWFESSSGVPQGSNLGPLLFSLFVNDAILYLGNGCCLVYADDLKLYILVNTIDDCRKLQTLLDKFATWCRANRMQLSIPKCFVISFHRKTNCLSFEYTLGGEMLNRVQTIRDLGVTLDTALSFRNHYEDIIDKARRQLGFVSKISKEFKDPYTLKSL